MKIDFDFMLKALSVLEMFTFWSWLLGFTEKRLDMKATVNFKIYDVTDWTTINYKAHNAQCFENVSLQKIISGQLIE